MKFALLFTSLFIYSAVSIFTIGNNFRYCVAWVSINMFALSLAYFFNRPDFILGKNSHGKINPLLLILNLPWTLFTWIVFKLQILVSKEQFCHQVKGTNIWISRRPGSHDKIDKFDLIIDLTCEFPADKTTSQYICYPNLDGHHLSSLPIIDQIPLDKKILIHCANGHGRSALFTALILKAGRNSATLTAASALITDSRTLAKPNKSQLKWLMKLEKTCCKF